MAMYIVLTRKACHLPSGLLPRAARLESSPITNHPDYTGRRDYHVIM